jgi:hypothetical protein
MELSGGVIDFRAQVPVSQEYDVVVVGGGSAGIAASVSAARNGAQTLLVERNGCLGGTSTVGLVGPFMTSYDAQSRNPVVGGVFAEVVRHMVEMGGAIDPATIPESTVYSSFIREGHGHVTPFQAEALKAVADGLVASSAVEVLFHTDCIAATREGNAIKNVVLRRKQGLIAVPCKYAIDCSGDGDLAVLSGAEFVLGRGDGKMQPASTFFRIGNVDDEKLEAWVRQHRRVHGEERLFECLVMEAVKNGEFTVPRRWINIYREPQPGDYRVNVTRVIGVDGTKSEDLTRGEMEGRQQVLEVMRFMRNHCPGLENARILQVADTLGIRETRHIAGDYVLTGDDVLEGRHFPDAIARYAYVVDIHDPTGAGGRNQAIKGDYYEIPVRCLLVKGLINLLVAGRCVSADHVANSSLRVIPACYATGEAAGTLAALAARQGHSNMRGVAVEDLQSTLRRRGAIV